MRVKQEPSAYRSLVKVVNEEAPELSAPIQQIYDILYQSRERHLRVGREQKRSVFVGAGKSLAPLNREASYHAMLDVLSEALKAPARKQQKLRRSLSVLQHNNGSARIRGLDANDPLRYMLQHGLNTSNSHYRENLLRFQDKILFGSEYDAAAKHQEEKPAYLVVVGFDWKRHKQYVSNGFDTNGRHKDGDKIIDRTCIGERLEDAPEEELLAIAAQDGATLVDRESRVVGTNFLLTNYDPNDLLTLGEKKKKIQPWQVMGFHAHVNTRHTNAIAASHFLEGVVTMTLSAESGYGRIGKKVNGRGRLIFSTHHEENSAAQAYLRQMRKKGR